MRQCLDPLEAVRRVGPDQPWCVTLPACYPTILPYTSAHADDPCVDARHSSSHAARPLAQRLRGRVERHQTPTSSDARQILHRLTRIVQQHVPEFVFHESPVEDANNQIKQERGSTVLSIPVPPMPAASHRSEQGSVSSRMSPVSCVASHENGPFL